MTVFDHVAVVLPREVGDLRRLIGKKVGILRTDERGRPVLVRAISDSEGVVS